MMRRLASLLCLLLGLVMAFSAAAEGTVIDLIADPDAEYGFLPDVPILEIYYPKIYGSDCTVLRCDGHVMLIDGSTEKLARLRVLPMLQDLGIDHVELAFNTHPHKDHLPGLAELYAHGIAIDRVLMGTSDRSGGKTQPRYERFFANAGVPVDYAEDGDVLMLGPVELTLFRRSVRPYNLNDESACALIRYGERTLISLADIEGNAMDALAANPPACGLKADILKYPHHGQTPMKEALYGLISPELTILTSLETAEGKPGYLFASRRGSAVCSSARGPLRLRTDGVIWVLDAYPPYRALSGNR